ncbi:MAG: helix-turn-helix domain-containing protein [Solirubrobacterales bacterium]
MSTIVKKENPAEQKVIDALDAAEGEVTVDEVAAAAGIGRTSARKYLAALEDAGTAKRTAGGREGKRKLPDRYSPIPGGEPPAGEEPSGEGAVVEEPPADGPAERLRPGGLGPLVVGYMREHAGEGPFGPSVVAKGLGRSSGAVGNCMERLASEGGDVERVGERPRRYALKG